MTETMTETIKVEVGGDTALSLTPEQAAEMGRGLLAAAGVDEDDAANGEAEAQQLMADLMAFRRVFESRVSELPASVLDFAYAEARTILNLAHDAKWPDDKPWSEA